jgi:GDP-L-fucose synthase
MILCQSYNNQYGTNFISILPANLYGPNDNFSPNNSHFVPSLIRKFHEAKINNLDKVIVWGTGKPRRELMHVDDAAKACLFLMDSYNSSVPLNAGVGKDYSILEIAELIKEIVGFEGSIELDKSKPDGIFSKLLDSSKIYNLGWKPEIKLREGLVSAYKWYLENF